MKNKSITYLVLLALGFALLLVSVFAPDNSVEKWASFALGLSFPLYIFSICHFTKKLKPLPIRVKK